MACFVKIKILSCEDFLDARKVFGRATPEYWRLFENLLVGAGAKSADIEIFDARTDKLPAVRAGEKYVITGSLSSAYDSDAWISALKDFVRAACGCGAKVVGICFGHQLVADALGGRVARAETGWGEGIRFSPLKSDFLKAYFPDGGFWLDYNHHDQVINLPPNAERLSGSEFCPNESYRIDGSILCFQGHPEFTREYSDMLFLYFKNEFPQPVQIARENAKGKPTDSAKIAKAIMQF